MYYLGARGYDNLICRQNHKAYVWEEEYSAVEVLKNSLYYVPQRPRGDDYLFDYEFQCSYLPRLEKYVSRHELAFVDTRPNRSISSKIILDRADLVVVILRQNILEIQEFFQNYSSLLDKAFFIIGNYNKKNPLTLRKIVSEFGFSTERIGIIPHCKEFQFAVDHGRMVEFISRCFQGSLDKEENYFIKELKKTTFLLMQQAVFNRDIECSAEENREDRR
ncbi:MAG: hypothetical protein IJY09_07500 [Lachnospiraceae bacterium]|nr:hypothetical protein [Lachnospiraceae bacterium]